MSYKPLAKLFYENTAPSRYSALEEEAHKRRTAESSFRTGVMTTNGELFISAPRELSVLNEKVLRLERKVSSAMRSLPPIAQASLVRSLILDEVVSTNDLEGIRSTRKQIDELLKTIEMRDTPKQQKRFLELTKLYLELSDSSHIWPTTPEAIREIYDRIMQGELSEKDMPDGKLFRAHGVHIIGAGEQILHSGVEPEEAIISTLQTMLAFVSSDDVPDVYSAIASHYIFEYIHPFYDGNGRTGRYLLALFLSRPFSVLTSLSLSRVLAENRHMYYRAFKEAQDPLNNAELTFFVLSIMNLIRIAQEELIEGLEKKIEALNKASAILGTVSEDYGLNETESNIVFMLVQVRLFGMLQDSSLDEIAHHIDLGTQMSRKHLSNLEKKGLVELTKKRPLRFVLANEIAAVFELIA